MIRKLCMITLAGFVALGLMTLPPVSGTAQAALELMDYETSSTSSLSNAFASSAARAFSNAGYSSDDGADTGASSGSGASSGASGVSSNSAWFSTPTTTTVSSFSNTFANSAAKAFASAGYGSGASSSSSSASSSSAWTSSAFTAVSNSSSGSSSPFQTSSISTSNDAFFNSASQAFANAGYSSGDDSGSGSEASSGASTWTYSVGEEPNNGSYYVVSSIGDSLTENSYLQSVMRRYFSSPSSYGGTIPYSLTLNDHGYGGYETGAILDIERSKKWGDSEGADFVLIMAGTNDAIHGPTRGWDASWQADRMISNIQQIVNIARGSDGDAPKIIVSGILPSLSGDISEVARVFNQKLTTGLSNVDLVINTHWYDLVDSATGNANGSLMADYAHPNNTGYDMMAENWFQAIDSFYNTSIAQNDANMYSSW